MSVDPTTAGQSPVANLVTPSQEAARQRQIELVLQGVDALPTLAPIASRLLALGSANDVDIAEISKIIESDPATSTRILALCRRADKGLGEKVTTVRRAIVMLGLDAVRSAVLSVSVYDLFEREASSLDEPPTGYWGAPASGTRAEVKVNAQAFDREGFWKYSVAVAAAAELIATRRREMKVSPEEAFTAGLLHALGKPVLELVLPKCYARVVQLAERQGTDSAPIERQIIGLDSFTAGRRIAEHWRLPTYLRDAMWLHSQPLNSLPTTEHKNLVAIVTLARTVVRNLHLGWSGDFGTIPDYAAVSRHVGLATPSGQPALKLDELTPAIHAEMTDRLEALGLSAGGSSEVLLESLAKANAHLGKLNAQLDERQKETRSVARVLEAVGAFNSHALDARSLSETLSHAAASAVSVLGCSAPSMLLQVHDDEAWRLYRFSMNGQVLSTSEVQPPPHFRDPSSRVLAGVIDPTQSSAMLPHVFPWLAESLAEPMDAAKLRLVPITRHSPTAVLIVDKDPMAAISVANLGVMTSAWGLAICDIARSDAAIRQGEQLAQLNRDLADAQARLAEAQSYARLGEIAAGAAHEMNNPLTIISGQAQLLLPRVKDSRDRASVVQIAEASEHLGALVRSLHLIASPPKPRIATCDVASVVQEALALAQIRNGNTPVRASVRVGRATDRARLDPKLLALALAELLVNAAEADPRGEIEFSTHVDPLDDALLFRVTDHGPGLSSKAATHAFDPFFSEKAAGRSHGLGLTRAKAIVEAMGGRIVLQSHPERGTIATLAIAHWRLAGPKTIAA